MGNAYVIFIIMIPISLILLITMCWMLDKCQKIFKLEKRFEEQGCPKCGGEIYVNMMLGIMCCTKKKCEWSVSKLDKQQ